MTCAYVYTHAYKGTINMKQPPTHTLVYTHIVISLSVPTTKENINNKKKTMFFKDSRRLKKSKVTRKIF